MIENTVNLEGCAHHWVIDSPSGPTSIGICKLCGDEQEFQNSSSDAGWERESGSEQAFAAIPVPTRGEGEEE